MPDFFTVKCTKFNFGRGSAIDPAGKLTALPRPLAGFGKEKERRKGGRGERRRRGEDRVKG